jgi:hypothetical protein
MATTHLARLTPIDMLFCIIQVSKPNLIPAKA